jgi:hypothetical protein
MRRGRVAGSLVVAVAVLAGCGDDATTTTSAVTTTVVAPTTTTASTTTLAPPATVDEVAIRVAVAQAFVGRYEGEWINTTFGSAGPMTLEVALAGNRVTVTLDLGGSVFGGSDPEPIVMEFDLSGEGPFGANTTLFGDLTMSTDTDGSRFVVEAPAVPGLGGVPMTMEALGDGAGSIAGTYTIPGLAEGTFQMHRV